MQFSNNANAARRRAVWSESWILSTSEIGLEVAQGAVSEEARGGTERGGGAFAAQGGDAEAEATGARHVPVMTFQLFSMSSSLSAPVTSATCGPASCDSTVIARPLTWRIPRNSHHASLQQKIDTDRDVTRQRTHSIRIEHFARQSEKETPLGRHISSCINCSRSSSVISVS